LRGADDTHSVKEETNRSTYNHREHLRLDIDNYHEEKLGYNGGRGRVNACNDDASVSNAVAGTNDATDNTRRGTTNLQQTTTTAATQRTSDTTGSDQIRQPVDGHDKELNGTQSASKLAMTLTNDNGKPVQLHWQDRDSNKSGAYGTDVRGRIRVSLQPARATTLQQNESESSLTSTTLVSSLRLMKRSIWEDWTNVEKLKIKYYGWSNAKHFNQNQEEPTALSANEGGLIIFSDESNTFTQHLAVEVKAGVQNGSNADLTIGGPTGHPSDDLLPSIKQQFRGFYL
jgi:hypothetical protein